MPRILVLCHGGRQTLSSERCPTLGVPTTPSAVADMTLLDLDASARPHVIADWRQPICLARRSFDIVTTSCCPYGTFISPTTGALHPTSFNNVVHVLKPGGHFVFTTAAYGIDAFARYITAPLRKGRAPRAHTSVWVQLAKHIQRQHPELRRVAWSSAEAKGWVADLAHRYDMGPAGYAGYAGHAGRDKDKGDVLIFRRA